MLACPPLEVTRSDNGKQAYKTDTANTLGLVSEAARVPALTWRVRVEGEAQVRGADDVV